MKISSQEEYGLRCLLQIAHLTKDGDLATLEQIAQAEHITTDYVAKLLSIFRNANLVESVRGKSGGYKLTRFPESIYLDEVIRVLSGELFETDSCQQYTGNDPKCIHINCCSIRSVWLTVSSVLFNILRKITLKDLLEKEDIVTKHLKKELMFTG